MLDITNVGYTFDKVSVANTIHTVLDLDVDTGSYYSRHIIDLYFFCNIKGVYLTYDRTVMVRK